MRSFTSTHHLQGILVAALLASSLGGCTAEQSTGASGDSTTGAGGSGGGGGFVAPDEVQVEILGATIALSPNGQECWDGVCSLSKADSDKVAAALAETGDAPAAAAAVAAVLAGYTSEAYGPPDPVGTATIWNGASYDAELILAAQEDNDEDTFTPTFLGSPGTGFALGWSGTFNKEWRIRVTLSDEDLANDDSIGVVEIGYDDIIAALQYGKVYPVRVHDQGNGAILFVNISAHGL